MENVVDILQSRGLLEAVTSDAIRQITSSQVKVYSGFDPTSDSLHLGNLVPIMGLAWFQRCGHIPVALIGGATGMIGDPSGKLHERALLDEATLVKNQAGIIKDLQVVLEKGPAYSTPLYVNNYDWFFQFSVLEFLRDVGKHFRVGVMLAKESVKARMQSEEGMSYTEFSYQLLQGYDFYHLYKNYQVTIQIGGSDQWGNITAGIDYVRKLTGQSVYGITLPLLTRSDGQKFGKSEKGAVWLSCEKLSSFDFYQYLIRIPDADVIKLLKMLTFCELGEIRELEFQMKESSYIPNQAQRILAESLTELIRGHKELATAVKATLAMMPGKQSCVDGATLEQLLAEIPSAVLAKDVVINQKLVDVVVAAQFAPSKGEVRRMIKNGGVWVNNQKIEDEQFVVSEKELIDEQYLLVALGKKHKAVVKISSGAGSA
jgi:tyrosyl-tRNA synthetase